MARRVGVVEEQFERISKSEVCFHWINNSMETCQRKGEVVHTLTHAVAQGFDLHGLHEANIHVNKKQAVFKAQLGGHVMQNDIVKCYKGLQPFQLI